MKFYYKQDELPFLAVLFGIILLLVGFSTGESGAILFGIVGILAGILLGIVQNKK